MTTQTVEREIDLLPGQSDILRDFTSSVQAAIAGTGGGKTMLIYWWLHSRMEAYPGYTWLLSEPTYSMLSKIILTSSDPDRPSLIDYFKEAGHHPDYHAVDRILHTDFGKMYLSSADNPDSMQGAAVKGSVMDEGGQMSLLAYETHRQRVSMMEGQTLIATTPYNLGWLLTEVWNMRNEPGFCVRAWRSIDRPGYPRARYEEEKKKLPPWRFAMLYDGRFERPAGLIYSAFNENVCLIDRFPIPKEWLIYVFHDFGTANPAALFTAQDPGTGQFYHFKEYLPGPGRSTHEHAEEFKSMTEGYNVVMRIGGSHQEEEIRQGYGAHGWPIVEPKITKVEAQIDKVIGMHQLNKIFAFKDMSHYLDEKRTFARELDVYGAPTEKIENESTFHLMACERYGISYFTPETVAYSGGHRPSVWN